MPHQEMTSPRQALSRQPPGALAHTRDRARSIWGAGWREGAQEALAAALGPAWSRAWLEALAAPHAPEAPGALEETFSKSHRHDAGIYLTPPGLAQGMAAALEGGEEAWGPGAVLDLSCGAGALLCAAAQAAPERACIGIEREPALAIACALELAALRRRQGRPCTDRVLIGDGLAAGLEVSGPVRFVVGNPPYVGEKGQRERFEALRQEHGHLVERFGPRIDLSYLFVHRALDWLAPGGRLVMLTSAYWLQATGAAGLREDLAERLHIELFLRVQGARLFPQAPGHHSLLWVGRRVEDAPAGQRPRAVSLEEVPEDWPAAIRGALEGQGAVELGARPVLESPARSWHPFGAVEARRAARAWRARCARLEELARDRQGFVSGADRVTRRHRRLLSAQGVSDEELPELGRGLFVMQAEEVPRRLDPLRERGLLVPLLRGSQVEPGRVWLEPPAGFEALYVDAEIADASARQLVEAHLSCARLVLERRREVRLGRIPWYRLHWPRDRDEQRGPKLVCPRRAPGPCFGLDLSGSVVSSDCTYLVAPGWAADPAESLLALMIALHAPETRRALEVFGKRKGELVELYSAPLRALALPLKRRGDQVVPDEGALGRDRAARWCERIRRARARLEQASAPRLDVPLEAGKNP